MMTLIAMEQTQGKTWEGEVEVASWDPRTSSVEAALAVLKAAGIGEREVRASHWASDVSEQGTEWVLTFISVDDLGCWHAHLVVSL